MSALPTFRSRKTDGEENITNVHRQENGDTDVREVKAVTPSDEPESDGVLAVSCGMASIAVEASRVRRAP